MTKETKAALAYLATYKPKPASLPPAPFAMGA